MKQLMVKSPLEPMKYAFTPISDVDIAVKDSYSFIVDGSEYIMCTNITDGGLAVLRKTSDKFVMYDTLFKGWTFMWAPCVIELGDKLFVFCSDTGGDDPWWKTQRIIRFEYDVLRQEHGIVTDVKIGNDDKGIIDPEIVLLGNEYVMFYTIMDWNATNEGGWEWWDIYYSVANSLLGPYVREVNLSQIAESGIEEAPFYNPIDKHLYWSTGSSDEGSIICRGTVGSYYYGVKGQEDQLTIEQDNGYRVAAINCESCTHPDCNPVNGRLRATLKKEGRFFIAEIV